MSSCAVTNRHKIFSQLCMRLLWRHGGGPLIFGSSDFLLEQRGRNVVRPEICSSACDRVSFTDKTKLTKAALRAVSRRKLEGAYSKA